MTTPHACRLLRSLVAWGCMLGFVAMGRAARSSWSVEVWSADVLGSRNINGLAQTPEGFLWIATPASVFRYDGARFVEFAPPTFAGEAGGRVALLTRSRDGSLWVAMNGGRIIHVNGDATRVFVVGDQQQTPGGLIEDGAGDIWFTLQHGNIGRLHVGKLTTFSISEHDEVGNCGLACDYAGQIWVAQNGMLGRMRDGEFVAVAAVPKIGQPRLTAASNGGGVWLGIGSQLFHCTEGGSLDKVSAVSAEVRNARISTLLEDRSGALWIGTADAGLMRYSAAGVETIPTSFRRINHLLEDNEGDVWVGTGGGGLDRVRRQLVVVEGAATGVPFESIRSLCEDAHGQLWAATHDGELVTRVDDRWTTIADHQIPRAVTSVAADRNGAVWVGTRLQRIYSLRDGELSVRGAADGIASRIATALFVSSTGTVWIVGSTPSSIQSLRDGALRNWPLPNNALMPLRIAEDAAGTIWIGTREGVLLRVAGDRIVEEPSFVPPGPSRPINSLHATADGALWVGYDRDGLGRVKDGRYANVRTEQGLYDDDIRLITDDAQGWLWLGSQRGIFKVRQSALDDVIAGRIHRVQSVRYPAREALPDLLAARSEPSKALRSRDRRLWFPLGTALAIVTPDSALDLPTASPVRVMQINVDGRPWAAERAPMPRASDVVALPDGTQNARVPSSHRKLEFEFACLSFSSPENVNFRYRLSGFDEGWIDAGAQHSAAYPRLAAGNYRFEVMACNSSGQWNQSPAAVAFTVAPFLWQTWWFRVAAVLAFTLAVVWAVRAVSYRRLHVKVKALEQQAAVEHERARIARDIHDDVGNRLTRILLLSGLAERDQAEPQKAAEHLRQIVTSATEMTESLDEIVWAVNPRNDTLAHLIDYIGGFAIEFLRTAGLPAEIDLPDRPPEHSVSAEVRHNFFLGIKEAINNVVRHAGATEVNVRIVLEGDELRATVADNGRGFAVAPANGTADGLRNMHARMAEIGGRCEIESTPGAGTRVDFVFRWRR